MHSEDAAEAPCLVAFGLLHPAVDINPLAAWRVLTLPPPEREAELHRPVAGQSHAWIEYWAGDWTGYDPTNRTPAVESHVVVGRGRDYDDVTPHKGVYRGVAGGPPEVTVEFTRVA